MVVRIRLARFGRRHAPFYNIVVTQARTARNSKPIEVLGTYDPIPKPPVDGEGRPWKDIKLDSTRAKYWLGVGAQPSDTAWRLLSMAGLLEPKFRPIDVLPKVPQPERKKWWDLKKEKADQKAQLKTADSAKTEKVKTSV